MEKKRKSPATEEKKYRLALSSFSGAECNQGERTIQSSSARVRAAHSPTLPGPDEFPGFGVQGGKVFEGGHFLGRPSPQPNAAWKAEQTIEGAPKQGGAHKKIVFGGQESGQVGPQIGALPADRIGGPEPAAAIVQLLGLGRELGDQHAALPVSQHFVEQAVGHSLAALAGVDPKTAQPTHADGIFGIAQQARQGPDIADQHAVPMGQHQHRVIGPGGRIAQLRLGPYPRDGHAEPRAVFLRGEVIRQFVQAYGPKGQQRSVVSAFFRKITSPTRTQSLFPERSKNAARNFRRAVQRAGAGKQVCRTR